jgi:prevent-host-death family protein
MTSVGIRELKEKLSGYIDRVRNGEEILVTDRGEEVAMITPVSKGRKAVMQFVRARRASWSGGKPAGIAGVKAKGKPLAKTILEDRR